MIQEIIVRLFSVSPGFGNYTENSGKKAGLREVLRFIARPINCTKIRFLEDVVHVRNLLFIPTLLA